MTRPIPNFLAFQLGWFAVILGAAAGQPWVGPAYIAVWLALHLRGVGAAWLVEAKMIFASGIFGYTADSLLVVGGWLSFPGYAQLGGPSPLWMVCLWMGFAATLGHALGWLRGRYLLAAVLGAIFGPLAYLAGARLGAVSLHPYTALALGMVASTWLVAMPLLVWLRARCEFTGNASDTVATISDTRGC
jgi:hypothetical protein